MELGVGDARTCGLRAAAEVVAVVADVGAGAQPVRPAGVERLRHREENRLHPCSSEGNAST